MPKIQHNGPDFRYVVKYSRLMGDDAGDVTEVVKDFRQEQLVIPDQPTFQAYRISVRAQNEMGMAADSVTDVRVGFSGEEGA